MIAKTKNPLKSVVAQTDVVPEFAKKWVRTR
jgi:hypothetical protein